MIRSQVVTLNVIYDDEGRKAPEAWAWNRRLDAAVDVLAAGPLKEHPLKEYPRPETSQD